MGKSKGNPFARAQQRRDEREAPPRLVEALLGQRQVVVRDIPVDQIEASPFQARLLFNNLEPLAESIRLHGFFGRLRVRPHPHDAERFQLVFGERRLRAARLAGLAAVPCEIAEHSDEEMQEIGLLENLHRRDLKPVEEGLAYRTLLAAGDYTVRSLAEKLAVSKGYVQNRLALADLPPELQALVREKPDALSAALILAKAPPAQQASLIKQVRAGEITKRELAAVVQVAGTEILSLLTRLERDVTQLEIALEETRSDPEDLRAWLDRMVARLVELADQL